MKKSELNNKNILIMGLGKFGGGLDCAKFAAGFDSKVIVTDMAGEDKLAATISKLKDLNNVSLHLGGHNEDDFIKADVVIVNPAVRPDNKFVQIARENGAIITSQIAIFFDNCPAKIIGITGANGKSTTTKITWHLLDFASKNTETGFNNVWLGGNIGNMPLLTELDSIKAGDLVVLEISSFQTEQLAAEKLGPQISAITNLTPNHLDRHGTFEEYCLAKEYLFIYQNSQKTDRPVSIFNGKDEITSAWFDKYKIQQQRDCLKFFACDVPEVVKANFALPGEANLSDLAAAMAIVKQFDVATETMAEAIKSFRGLPHRLELVAEGRGIKWYSDSIATTPPSTIVGLEAFDEPVVLIAGGYDKMLPFDEMGVVVAKKATAAILIGTTTEKIANAIEQADGNCIVYKEKTFIDAINRADEVSRAGDIVLMSPACASYDMFDNFQQRGDIFKDTAQKICKGKQ